MGSYLSPRKGAGPDIARAVNMRVNDMQDKTSYSRGQIFLHWLIAVLILGNWFISEGMEDAFDGSMEGAPVSGFVPFWHVYAGMAVLGLV
ncbi:MAG: hypothetical protein ORN49_12180, partial [Rhodobacteraceae bacterium]|nr:hypothetical protein [Paracoccaceae bacterium]